MPRPREYNRENVLAAATELFWRRGFAGTSINNLVKACSIGRRSLYEEFGGKESLFLASIDHYLATKGALFEQILRSDPLGLANVERLLEERVKTAARDGNKGCLIVNSALEMELCGDRVRRKLRKISKANEELLCSNFQAAQETGDVATDRDCRELAQYTVCVAEGLMVMNRQNHKAAELRSAVQVAVLALRG